MCLKLLLDAGWVPLKGMVPLQPGLYQIRVPALVQPSAFYRWSNSDLRYPFEKVSDQSQRVDRIKQPLADLS